MFWNWRGGSAEPSRPVSSFCSFYKKSKNNSSNFLKNIKYKGFSTQDNLDLDKGLDTVVQSKKFRMTKRKQNNHEENFVIFTTTWILLGQFENTEYGLRNTIENTCRATRQDLAGWEFTLLWMRARFAGIGQIREASALLIRLTHPRNTRVSVWR